MGTECLSGFRPCHKATGRLFLRDLCVAVTAGHGRSSCLLEAFLQVLIRDSMLLKHLCLYCYTNAAALPTTSSRSREDSIQASLAPIVTRVIKCDFECIYAGTVWQPLRGMLRLISEMGLAHAPYTAHRHFKLRRILRLVLGVNCASSFVRSFARLSLTVKMSIWEWRDLARRKKR